MIARGVVLCEDVSELRLSLEFTSIVDIERDSFIMSSSNERHRRSSTSRNRRASGGFRRLSTDLYRRDDASFRQRSPPRPTTTTTSASQRWREELMHRATASNQPPMRPCTRNQDDAEDDMVEEMRRLVHDFLTGAGQRLHYNNVIRWTVDSGNGTDYSVVVIIDQPSALI